MYTITAIENAIVAALNADPITDYAKTVGSYAGQLEQEEGKVLLITPAVLVAWGGDPKYDRANALNTSYNRVSDWTVFAACKNLRSDVAARQGVGSEIGMYEMLDDIRTALTGKRLSLQIEPLRIISRMPVVVKRTISVYAVKFQTQLDYVA